LGRALVALACLVIAYCVHSALQPRFSQPLATEAALGVAAACLTLLVMLLLKRTEFREETVVRIAIAFAAAALFLNRARPRLLAVLVLAAFAIVFIDDRVGGRVLSLQRSFFGVLRTEEHIAPAPGTTLRVLMHGTTIHGAQLHGAPEIERRPLTYYSPNTALGEAVLAGLSGGTANSLALIGMGAGTTACLMSPQDRLTVFEIDRKVVRLSAERGGLFTYIPDCQPHARIVLGDGRLSIARERDRSFDVILVDAFSSDAVPAHLLTEEAIALYLRKTSARGIVILHLSNRNLALVSEAVRVAHALNAPFLWRASERRDDRAAGIYGAMGASVMILAHDPQTLARLALASNDWHVLPTPPGRPWTDDYINLPRALYDNLNGREECLQSERRIGCASPRP
ncbi:MAG: spermidine synthase, partial [Hyphomonadaceae bacterium]